jgi:hypothetical protein
MLSFNSILLITTVFAFPIMDQTTTDQLEREKSLPHNGHGHGQIESHQHSHKLPEIHAIRYGNAYGNPRNYRVQHV